MASRNGAEIVVASVTLMIASVPLMAEIVEPERGSGQHRFEPERTSVPFKSDADSRSPSPHRSRHRIVNPTPPLHDLANLVLSAMMDDLNVAAIYHSSRS